MRLLTVAICTRDRAASLRQACAALLRALDQLDTTERAACEILLIDDGRLDPAWLIDLASAASQRGIGFRYQNKRADPGLLRSRVLAAQLATGAIVLFLDDDADVAPDYLVRLLTRYRDHPEVVGVGGIDARGAARPRSRLREWCDIAAGLAALRVGRLSPGGYSHDAVRWPHQPRPFPSRHLQGCNMSFRREALADLRAPSWLVGYGLGEDLWVSWIAARHGPLLVDPALRVDHRQDDDHFGGRADRYAYHRAKILNHHRLLRETGAPWWRHAAQLWTAALLLAHHGLSLPTALLRPSRRYAALRRARGTAAGLAGALRELIRHPEGAIR